MAAMASETLVSIRVRPRWVAEVMGAAFVHREEMHAI
jgi:hypothetical protein